MHRSESRPASPSTAPTPAVLGSEAATKTPTDSCANTSPRAPTSRVGMLKRLKRLQPCSTADPARPLIGRHLLKHSTSIYYWSNKPVLRQSIEPSQFTSWSFTQNLQHHKLLGSMGTVGDCFDNAPMESFWGSMQIELLNRQRWRTILELSGAIADWLENFYNTERRHSALNYLTPNEYEELHSTQPTQVALP